MRFMLVCHGQRHLEVSSDDGHTFRFDIVPDVEVRRIVVGGAKWRAGETPFNSSQFIAQALSFASVCAEDFGLI